RAPPWTPPPCLRRQPPRAPPTDRRRGRRSLPDTRRGPHPPRSRRARWLGLPARQTSEVRRRPPPPSAPRWCPPRARVPEAFARCGWRPPQLADAVRLEGAPSHRPEATPRPPEAEPAAATRHLRPGAR